MLYISALPLEEKQTLNEGYSKSKKKYFRDRCQCMQLSSEGFKIKELSLIFKTRTHTISTWIHRYDAQGILGLKILPGRGLKTLMNTLNIEQIAIIKDEISHNPQNLRDVATVLSQLFGFKLTKLMLKSYLKKTKVHMASPTQMAQTSAR
jgi:transposase